MGLALDSFVGYETGGKDVCNVPETHLKTLVDISNQRFVENTKRIERFRDFLSRLSHSGDELGLGIKKKGQDGEEWEDQVTRRERMRVQGMERSMALRLSGSKGRATDRKIELPDPESFQQNT